MDAIQAFSIGWDLDHPAIRSTTFADAPKLNRADVVFLSVPAMEEFWNHAVGDRVPLFRSAVRERDAWDALLRRVTELKQMIKRGGLLVCRLDRPCRRCLVRLRPPRGAFPKVDEIDGYHALGGVHKGLRVLAEERFTIGSAELEPGSATHPFASYVGHFFWELTPTVALPESPRDATVLAQTTDGEPVAMAWPGCVALCRLAVAEPRREAHALLRSACELLEKPLPESFFEADPSRLSRSFPLPGLEQLVTREQQLSQSIAELQQQRLEVCRQRGEMESLWGLVQPTGRDQLRRSVVVALELLGFLVRGDSSEDSDSLVIHSAELDAAGVVLFTGDDLGKTRGSQTIRWPSIATGSATKFYLFLGSENPGGNPLETPLAAQVIRAGGCVVPTAELLAAVRISLGNPGLSKQTLRRSLAERTGVYQLAESE